MGSSLDSGLRGTRDRGMPGDEGLAEGTRDAAMMKILNAVREGSLKPEEADRLIAAWAELHRGSGDTRAE
jgi:hypothetical protein